MRSEGLLPRRVPGTWTRLCTKKWTLVVLSQQNLTYLDLSALKGSHSYTPQHFLEHPVHSFLSARLPWSRACYSPNLPTKPRNQDPGWFSLPLSPRCSLILSVSKESPDSVSQKPKTWVDKSQTLFRGLRMEINWAFKKKKKSPSGMRKAGLKNGPIIFVFGPKTRVSGFTC